MTNSSPNSSPDKRPAKLVLVRHGETEWSKAGKHTGTSDIPLTRAGREEAERLGGTLRDFDFELVLTSPLARAVDTCRLAGLGAQAVIDGDLREWNYGEYDGLTTPEIRAERPGWSLWKDAVIGGESVDEVGNRAERVLKRARTVQGDVALFAHGHILRILTARWLDLPAKDGKLFALNPATISILAWEHDDRVMSLWNQSPAGTDLES